MMTTTDQARPAAADGYESVTVRSADGRTTAIFVPAANMVCASLVHDGVEYLDQGRGVAAYASEGATMGIPLLHPWANRLGGFSYDAAGKHVSLPRSDTIPVDERGLPIHGVVPHLLHWEVVQATGSALRATLPWGSSTLLALFPFPHRLEFEIAVDTGRLVLATTLRPSGPSGVPVSFGYHPYLRIPGAPREMWRVRLGVSHRLVLDGRMLPTGRREPIAEVAMRLGALSLDDAFQALSAPARFEAVAGGTRVSVEFLEGFPYAQVYAPAGRDVICFEPMTAPANALSHGDGLRIVGPGDAHRAVFMISIDPGN